MILKIYDFDFSYKKLELHDRKGFKFTILQAFRKRSLGRQQYDHSEINTKTVRSLVIRL